MLHRTNLFTKTLCENLPVIKETLPGLWGKECGLIEKFVLYLEKVRGRGGGGEGSWFDAKSKDGGTQKERIR